MTMGIETILIADKPLNLGGIPREISLKDFEAQYQVETGKPFKWLTKFGYAPHSKWAKLGLVLCKINEKVGYGVFASKAIKKDTLVGIYAGKKVDLYEIPSNTQGYFLSSYIDETKKFVSTIDATNEGNMTRFFNHLPDDSFKKKFPFFD